MHQNSFVEKEVTNVDGFLQKMVSIYKRDKAFLKTAEESATKSGDNYIVLISFKKEILIMADTRKQAMQRLMYLKWRFNKDLGFFEDYKNFMNNLLVKVYPRSMDDETKRPEKALNIYFSNKVPFEQEHYYCKPGLITKENQMRVACLRFFIFYFEREKPLASRLRE